MLFTLLDLWDRLAAVRDRFKGVWTLWIVGALLIGAWIAFLVLESLWETMTSRRAPSIRTGEAPQRTR
jgi:hypothetical protein